MLDIQAIQRLLPHRFPFLLIDRVLEVDGDHVVAIKNVSINEPFFAGHFPGQPVMPGVLILEAMAQAGAVLAIRGSSFDPDKQVVYFMALDKAKFRRPVVPGDQLRIEVVPLRKGGAVWKFKGKALVDGNVACEAEFLATMAPKGDGPGEAPGADEAAG